MSPGPIPWTAVDRYAARHNIAGDRFGALVRLVRALDAVYLEHANKD